MAQPGNYFAGVQTRINWDMASVEEVKRRMSRVGRGLESGSRSLFYGLANEITQWMQDNAVWQDRTGAARSGLKAVVTEENKIIEMVFQHTVEYGYWLEVIHHGQLGIIRPTLDHWGPEILDELHKRGLQGLVALTDTGVVEDGD